MTYSIEIICAKKLQCGESPLWRSSSDDLFWTDNEGIGIYKFDSERCGVLNNTVHASSLALHINNGLVIGNNTGFHFMNEDGVLSAICRSCDNRPISKLNDIVTDPLGRIFGGQECFDPESEYEPGFLYRIDLDGNASIVEDGLHISNGMGFSPDESTFYLVDTIPREIYAYTFDKVTGSISNKRIFAKLNQKDGLPDGLTVDAEGHVWVARFLGGGITRFDPDGKVERKIELPFAQPTSLTFGGADFSEIYITSASAYWETDLAPRNHNYIKARGGELIRIKQDVVGKPEYRCKIQIK